MNDSPEELIGAGHLSAAGSTSIQSSSVRRVVAERPTVKERSDVPNQYAQRGNLSDRHISSTSAASACGYEALESDFRSHHATNAARRRGPYEHYRLVYRYGYDLGTDPRYRDAMWADVEREARPCWEERNPGTWASFRETIRYAWNQARRRGTVPS